MAVVLLLLLAAAHLPGGTCIAGRRHVRRFSESLRPVTSSTPVGDHVSQRPASLIALDEPSGVPAWRTILSWYLVANQDQAIPPAAVTALILAAARATR